MICELRPIAETYIDMVTEFNLTDEVKEGINSARQSFKAVCDSMDMNYIKVDGYGKNYIKKYKLSPDSFMQLAIQVMAISCKGAINNFYVLTVAAGY